jgi:signal transduction histidine kinase
VQLAASVGAMTEKLVAEEATLILKLEELTHTQSQLVRSERLASVGRLAAGVAHEIGNPIAALMGMQDLLLDGDLPPETQRDFLRRMRKETDRIHTVVRDLLDFARPEGPAASRPVPMVGGAPAPPGAPSAADVRSAFDDVVGLVKTQKPFRDIRLEMDLPDDLGVALPAARLTQVLLNLVLNAGAAIASAGRPEGRIVLRGRKQEPSLVRIEVEDNGPGIAPALRDHLFEPFVTTKGIGEGTGLGLAVCRGVVESAHGQIGVDASYAGGARIFLLLPRRDPSGRSET